MDAPSTESSDENRLAEREPLFHTIKVPLHLKKRQHARLQRILDTCRGLYNAANEQRHAIRNRFLRDEWIRSAVRKAAKLKKAPVRNRQPTRYDHQKELTKIRADDQCIRRLSVSVLRGALVALTAAWKRVGAPIANGLGGYVQPPLYKAQRRDHAISWDDPGCVTVRNGRLVSADTGALRMHRKEAARLPDIPHSAVRLVREPDSGDLRENRGGRWFAAFSYPLEPQTRRRRGRNTGLDAGLDEYATGCDGVVLRATRPGKAAEKIRKRQHRALAYKKRKDGSPKREMSKRGSKRRAKQVRRMRRTEAKVARQRRGRAAQAAARIVKRYDAAVIEAASNLAGLYRGFCRKAVYDAAWAIFRRALVWGFTKVGGAVIEVPAAGTSQTCPACGRRKFDSALSERWRQCECGWAAPRDVTSAFEILRRGAPELLKRGGGAPWGRNALTGERVVPETPVRQLLLNAGARRHLAAAASGPYDLLN